MKPYTTEKIIRKLLGSNQPSIVYKTRRDLLDEDIENSKMQNLREEIRNSHNCQSIISFIQKDGTIHTNPYTKWQGPHWTLYSLALLEYPEGDQKLLGIRDQIYNWLFEEKHLNFPRSVLYPDQIERFRRCASQEGNAIWYSIKLGLTDNRTDDLVKRLIKWQWPDGGWNCDKREEARKSSVMETLIPLRALNLHKKVTKNTALDLTIEKTSNLFLKRKLLWQLSSKGLIDERFLKIQYPVQFFDLLFVLEVMGEIGIIKDPRCQEALQLLMNKQLPDGGFPLEIKNAKTSNERITRGSFADWGPAGKTSSNEYVTVTALSILKKAGILSLSEDVYNN